LNTNNYLNQSILNTTHTDPAISHKNSTKVHAVMSNNMEPVQHTTNTGQPP